MTNRFSDRSEAGRALAARLAEMKIADPVIFALPRGGVPVAAEIARALNAPLDLLLVRKIGVPWQPELALAAVVDGDDPQVVIDEEVQGQSGVSRTYIDGEAKEQLREIERRRAVYLQGRSPVAVENRTAIVVDDGIATGTTVRAALKALRRRKPARLILAVPVAPPETIDALAADVDQIVCLEQPSPFYAIGLYYVDFHQVSDEEVMAALAAATPLRSGT
jgi:putative phosphoribosyl transferase